MRVEVIEENDNDKITPISIFARKSKMKEAIEMVERDTHHEEDDLLIERESKIPEEEIPLLQSKRKK